MIKISVTVKESSLVARKLPETRSVPMWVKLLVFWHVFCITVWACPKPSDKLLSGAVKPAPLAVGDQLRIFDDKFLKSLAIVSDYLCVTGTWQYWDMFAPDPASIDIYGDAIVKFKDGSTRLSLYPRMYTLPIPAKYFQERFRKFFERASDSNTYPYILTQFCYHHALANYNNPKNPPVMVSLRTHSLKIYAPDKPQPKSYSTNIYYFGVIDQKQLDALKDGPP